jgi:hypothetical protein
MAFQPPPRHSLRARRGGFQQTLLALVLGVAVTSLLFGLASCSKEEKRAVRREVVLQTATFPGAHPWTSDLTSVTVPTEGEATSPVTPSGGPASPVDVSGTLPELYGGVTGVPALDRDKLVTDLDANPPMAAAWRTAAGASDVNGYVRGLTPVVLIHDTEVTDHAYQNGIATPFQSVLQAGTPVLIDDKGVPRVRGTSGSPLSEPERGIEPAYSGNGWPTFDQTSVVAVQPAPEPAKTMQLLAVTPVGEQAATPFQPDITVGETVPVVTTRTAPPPPVGSLPVGPLPTPARPQRTGVSPPTGATPRPTRPTGAQPSGTQPTGPQPTGATPRPTRPTGAQPTGPTPTGVKPTPTGGPTPTGVKPTPTGGPKPTGVQPTEPQPTGGPRPTGQQPTGVQPTGPKPTGVQPTGPQPTGGPKPTGGPQPTAAKPTGVPQPTAAPKPTGAPQPTAAPKPTGAPQPTAAPKPTGARPT